MAIATQKLFIVVFHNALIYHRTKNWGPYRRGVHTEIPLSPF